MQRTLDDAQHSDQLQPRVLARYFEEDIVYRLDKRGRGQVGLIVASCEDESDTEDEQSIDSGYPARPQKGQAKVAWYPTGVEELVDEKSVQLYDRSLLPGDVVRRLNQHGGQLGYVSAASVKLNLQILGTNHVITQVDADDFVDVFPIGEGEIVIYKDWVGYTNQALFSVIVEAANGQRFKVYDYDYYLMERVCEEYSKDYNCETTPYVGELLLADQGHLRSTTTYPSHSDEKFYDILRKLPHIKVGSKAKVLLRVIDVLLSQIEVRWLFCKPVMPSENDPPQTISAPPETSYEDSIQSIKPVNYYKKNSIQTSDRGYYVIKESDTLMTYDDWCYDLTDFEDNNEAVAVSSSSRNSHRCKIRKHKSPVSMVRNKRKKLKASKPKFYPKVDVSPGQKVAVQVIATELTTEVTWQDGTVEENIPSTELYPIHHVNDHEFFPGDFVVENKEDFSFAVYGVVQQVCRAERTATVNWFRIIFPQEYSSLEKTETVSVYDIKDHPDFQYRPGSIVMKIDKCNTDLNPGIESYVGQLIKFLPSGKLYCKWMNDTYEAVDPQTVIHISANDGDDFFDDSGDDYETSFTSTSPSPHKSDRDLLSRVLESVNELEMWLSRNDTFNNQNALKVSKMVSKIVKSMRQVDEQFNTSYMQLEELKSLVDVSHPPTANFPSETPLVKLLNKLKNMFEKNSHSPSLSTVQDSTENCDSPVSRRTKASMDVLRKLKLQLFPLCNTQSEVELKDDSIECTSTSISTDDVNQTTGDTSKDETVVDESLHATGGKVIFMDSVPDCHRFKLSKFDPERPKEFTSTYRKEIKLLGASLPEGIIVKAFHDRLDLISFMIVGPRSTPYEDGLFLFDVQLPAKYPRVPPSVYYISYCNDRLNPNLYDSGKVCVSLLGTWNGKGSEVWFPGSSNLLQVIISIQGLILVPEPYYNEAGYGKQKDTDVGNENSRLYNEMAVVKVVQSMTRMLSNPPLVFRDEIYSHAKSRGPQLLARLKGWASEDATGISADFPLLPSSKGFRLSLLRAVCELEKVLQDFN